jgi:hypothetical protein
MGKDTTKNLVGQPVFKQVIKILPREQFDLVVRQCGSDRYYKSFFSWDQLVVMLFGIFSRCDSMGGVCDGMRALGGKLNYLGMDSAPSKSTAGDALRDRNNEVFMRYYFVLIRYFKPLLSVSRKEKISFEKFYALDSTTITLFSDVMKGVGRNHKGDGREKGGLKVHMLTDVHAETAFKKIKQNFQLHFFYSDTENGIKTQVWCTLIAHLLLNVIRVLSKSRKAFSTVAALIRIHLISHLDLM